MGLYGFSTDASFAGAKWKFGAHDADAVKQWETRFNEDATKESFFDSLIPKTPITPAAPHVNLMWRLESAWQAYRRELHDYLFPEFSLFDEDDD